MSYVLPAQHAHLGSLCRRRRGARGGQAFILNSNARAGGEPSRSADRQAPRGAPLDQVVRLPAAQALGFIHETGVERIDLLKIDVEKSELEVLAGSIGRLFEDRPDRGRGPRSGRAARAHHGELRGGIPGRVEQNPLLAGTGLYDVFARAGVAMCTQDAIRRPSRASKLKFPLRRAESRIKSSSFEETAGRALSTRRSIATGRWHAPEGEAW